MTKRVYAAERNRNPSQEWFYSKLLVHKLRKTYLSAAKRDARKI